ncbi:MAG TPA: hypothetical protein VF517_16005 [Thermoleophilaceae bacterium]
MEREESDLYGLPLDEFIPARTALEKQLRKEGERERAAAVKKLPKPSVAAWAVNQASRCRPKERRALMDASAALREVQERLLTREATAADLERATTAQREAIGGLLEAASGLLTSEGKSMGEATLTRVRETFAAVATDPELAELVEAGVLDRERQATGLGFALGAGPAAPARSKGSRGGKSSGKAAPNGSGKARGGGLAKAGSAKAGSAKAGSARSKGSAGAGNGGTKGGGSKAAGKAGVKRETARAEAAEREAAERERREAAARAARERLKAAKKEESEAERRVEAAERATRKAAEELDKRERQVEEARARADSAREELEAASAARDEAAQARESAAAAAAELE